MLTNGINYGARYCSEPLVCQDVNLTANKLENVPATVLYFVKKPVLKDVLASADDLHQTLIGKADVE